MAPWPRLDLLGLDALTLDSVTFLVLDEDRGFLGWNWDGMASVHLTVMICEIWEFFTINNIWP